MAQDDERQQRAKDILAALDQSFERQQLAEERDEEEKAVRYESALTRLKDAAPPPPE